MAKIQVEFARESKLPGTSSEALGKHAYVDIRENTSFQKTKQKNKTKTKKQKQKQNKTNKTKQQTNIKRHKNTKSIVQYRVLFKSRKICKH